MPRTLTPKQEKFCQQIISTGNASEAYRQSYDCSRMKKENVGRRAKELIDNGKVAARSGELLDEGRKYHDIRSVSDAALQASNQCFEFSMLRRVAGTDRVHLPANLGVLKVMKTDVFSVAR